jgi:TDG/mug DNA glycosylase family protein
MEDHTDRTLPDLVGPNLIVLFCGINPGLKSAELGQHFARPGNRFWKLLHAGGFTDRVLLPGEQSALPEAGVGITNLVTRPSAAASELRPEEIREGARQLESKLVRLQPRCLAVLGLQAYRTGFTRPKASIGLQPDAIADVPVWLLPNPSGLQAKYQLADMAAMYQALHQFAIDDARQN